MTELPRSRRYLGLDVGDRRIGIAVSDPTGMIATPVEVYTRRNTTMDIDHIMHLMEQYEAVGAVVGLPLNMNGSEGQQAEKTRAFAVELGEHGVDTLLWDERLSTVEVTRRLHENGRRRGGIAGRVDAEAAALILQTYLDATWSGLPS